MLTINFASYYKILPLSGGPFLFCPQVEEAKRYASWNRNNTTAAEMSHKENTPGFILGLFSKTFTSLIQWSVCFLSTPTNKEIVISHLLITEDNKVTEKLQSHQARSEIILNQGNFILERIQSP